VCVCVCVCACVRACVRARARACALLRKSGSAGNHTRDLWIGSQELSPLDRRGSLPSYSDVKANGNEGWYPPKEQEVKLLCL
jgi:hypothetical protein